MADNGIEQSVGTKPRIHWTGRIGFVMAAAGSAIGLGNIWKFPYITGEFGGGAFVLVYLLCVVMVGLPLMVAELMIGRRAQENPVGAFQRLHKKASMWQAPGWLGVASGFLILSFYSVVAGWALAYIFKSIVGFSGTAEEITGQFGALASSPGQSILWHTIFMALTMGIVYGGIQRGIERWSKILMPILFILLFGLMVMVCFFLMAAVRHWHLCSSLISPSLQRKEFCPLWDMPSSRFRLGWGP